MEYSKVDPELIKVIEAISKLTYRNGSLCVTFSDIRRELNLHPQAITNLLKRGRTIGLITECSELGIGESGYTVLLNYVISLGFDIVSEIFDISDNFVIMKHRVKNKLYNNALVPFRGVIVKVFGDLVLDKPLIYRGKGYYEINLVKSIDKYHVFHLDSDVEIKPRETFTYEYEFYLKYFPPVDYFIVEPFNPVTTFNAKTYLTRSGKRIIKSVKVEYPPNVIVREEEGKTYHEITIMKLSTRSVKFWFHFAE
ncbi:hypothetical protein [Sulfurisphaera tokodaii]|uniref:Uncharacterized protein n=2 Tax=Sulfurisphaera tokodaii TaxID=111955 RepID=Q970P7_SULTO|nr:hypothetical protein [Sulfurisphaera tokodaii]BAB66626.1 hypothetical protein STK_15530 [Sulfurisphaera tokodaii str. 7]HII73554.1 hypothetical protein [Sulfurisphaera tokodaii]